MLSGDLKVNDHVIAHWVARRLESLKGYEETHRYKITYQDFNTGNVTMHVVQHLYSDGAAVLLYKLLEVVNNEQKFHGQEIAETILREQDASA